MIKDKPSNDPVPHEDSFAYYLEKSAEAAAGFDKPYEAQERFYPSNTLLDKFNEKRAETVYFCNPFESHVEASPKTDEALQEFVACADLRLPAEARKAQFMEQMSEVYSELLKKGTVVYTTNLISSDSYIVNIHVN